MHISLPVILGAVSFIRAFPHFAGPGGNYNSPPGALMALKAAPGNSAWSRLKPKHFTWKAPGPDDQRTPCPVMNTLCNHGLVPHDGRNITLDKLTVGLVDALNIAPARAVNIFQMALITNPIPNATFFDMGMLDAKNAIEHDGSLSRRDSVFDPTNSFDEATFNNFVSYFGDEQAINTSIIANARARQALDMSRINPAFSITQAQIPVIVGENAMLLVIFGHPENPVANKSFLEYFFRNERLPVELGWVPVHTPIDAQLGQMVHDIIAQSPPDVPLTFNPQTAA